MSTSVSQTVMDLLAALTDNLKDIFPALLLANIITSVLSNKPTRLQIAFGNLIRDSKSLINQLYQFRITCSYDEILRFKRSTASRLFQTVRSISSKTCTVRSISSKTVRSISRWGHYEGRLWTKCSTRRFVMEFHRLGTPILLVESLFSEFDSSNGQFDSAFHEVDSSFCEVVWSTCQFVSPAGLFAGLVILRVRFITDHIGSSSFVVLSFRRFDASFHNSQTMSA